MSHSYPDRCQHLKTNGTQCGSPALRSNKFCYFHKRYQEERIRLGVDRRRRGTATFFLPVLEDANSIQMSLMQIMRLLLTGQIEHKTASLLLYALQTASANLRQADFNPRYNNVIFDPRNAAGNPLGGLNLWNDHDFHEDEEEEIDEREREIQEKVDAEVRKTRHVARSDAEREIKAREKQEQDMKRYVALHSEYMLVRRNGTLAVALRPTEAAKTTPASAASVETKSAVSAPESQPVSQAATRPAPVSGAPQSAAQVREKINAMIREAAPELTKAYNEAMKKQAEERAKKKPPMTETMSAAEKKPMSS